MEEIYCYGVYAVIMITALKGLQAYAEAAEEKKIELGKKPRCFTK